ncbi:MAG: hypothetical protein CFE43_12170 [Burkholderiales bacterium PBB3]|nr:MAG: hypothetical protein CFE43_12170 [Burkholderiales bacterium PBB3]
MTHFEPEMFHVKQPRRHLGLLLRPGEVITSVRAELVEARDSLRQARGERSILHKAVSILPTPLSRPWRYAILLLLLITGAAQAGVQKCTGPDGKVIFSDQACATGQTSSTLPGVSTSAAPVAGSSTGAGKASYDDMVQRSRRAQVHAALTPECRALGDNASRALRTDTASLEEVKRAVSQFENQCGDQVQKASAVAATRRATPDASDCRSLRQSLEERRARLKTMTNRELQEFVKFQNEVSVGCR